MCVRYPKQPRKSTVRMVLFATLRLLSAVQDCIIETTGCQYCLAAGLLLIVRLGYRYARVKLPNHQRSINTSFV